MAHFCARTSTQFPLSLTCDCPAPPPGLSRGLFLFESQFPSTWLVLGISEC